jgi:hypothetical protein
LPSCSEHLIAVEQKYRNSKANRLIQLHPLYSTRL